MNIIKSVGYIKNQKNLRTIGTFSFFCLMLISIISVFPIVNKDEDAEATAIPSATPTLNITSSNIAGVNISASDANGTFSSSDSGLGSGLAFSVTTNNITGYTLSIQGTDDTRRLNNTQDGTSALESITAATSEETFATGSVSDYDNRWGYKPSKYVVNNVPVDNTNYLPGPITLASTLDITDSANTTPNEYTIELGARVDYTKPIGTYTNTYQLIAVGRLASYYLIYRDTTGEAITSMPDPENINNDRISGIILSDVIPERSYYTFAGWCDGTVSHVSGYNSTCDGDFYAAGSAYEWANPTADTLNEKSLYAMWNVNYYNVAVNFAGVGVDNVTFTNAGHPTVTVSTSGGTASLAYNAPYTMTANVENSDYEFYSWSLNDSNYGTLDSTSDNPTTFTIGANNNAVITATGRHKYIQDITSNECSILHDSFTAIDRRDNNEYTVRDINGNCWMTQNLRYIGDTGSVDGTIVMSATNSNIDVDKSIAYKDLDSNINLDDDYQVYDAARIHVATADQVPEGATYTAYDMGIWYNYFATTAGTISGKSNSSRAIYDICPKGWRLPTSSEQSDIVSYAGDYNPIDGGYYRDGQVKTIDYAYWISSEKTNKTQYDQRVHRTSLQWHDIGDSGELVIDFNERNSGVYVRCVSKNIATITFDGNGADGGSMSAQTIADTGALNSNAFTRTDHSFLGWNTAADGSGTSYADGGTYTAVASGNVTLYAQWAPTMQSFTASMCESQASSKAIQVVDKRDGELYYVQKLADGNCWLLENLRLDPTAVSLADLKGNTNATDETLTYFKNGGGSSPYPASGVVAKTADGGSWTNSAVLPFVATGYRNTEQAAVAPAPAGKIGVYYNYCAASAGSYCYPTTVNGGNAEQDICPAGWKLPTGSQDNGSYYYLYNTGYAAKVADFEPALRTTLSGYVNAGSATGQGSNVSYWTSSRYGNSNMYRLTATKSAVTPQSNYARTLGFSVRCILK